MEPFESQLFLPGLQDLAQTTAKNQRHRTRIGSLSPDDFSIKLNRALASENLAFATYTIMLAARAHAVDERITVPALSLAVGYSYHAVRNQIRRTPWWITYPKETLSTVSLTPEAHTKLERVARRLSRNDR